MKNDYVLRMPFFFGPPCILHVVVEGEAAEEGSKGEDGGGDPGGGGGSGQEVDCHPGAASHHELG